VEAYHREGPIVTVKAIGLIAAMPEEIKPLLRRVGKVTKRRFGSFRGYHFKRGGKEIFIIESGIGAAKAKEATRILIEAATPGVILNFGFGGAALPGPTVGDIVAAERVFAFENGQFREQAGLVSGLTANVAVTLEQQRRRGCFCFHCGTFITTGEVVGKSALAQLLPVTTTNPVLEMETAAVAQVAYELNISVAAVRAISDGADENLDFSIADFTDKEMRISIRKIFWALARKPRILPQLLRLGKNCRLAGDNLAVAVIAFIDGMSLPPLDPPSRIHAFSEHQSLAAADHG